MNGCTWNKIHNVVHPLSLSLSRSLSLSLRGREAAQTSTGRACRSSSRKQDTRLADGGPKFTSDVCQAYGSWWTDGHATVREMALKRSLWCGTWAQIPPRGWGGTSRPSTLTDTRPPCFEVEKHALRLGASAHYHPTNMGQHKRDGVPPWKETKAVAMELGHSGPSGSVG